MEQVFPLGHSDSLPPDVEPLQEGSFYDVVWSTHTDTDPAGNTLYYRHPSYARWEYAGKYVGIVGNSFEFEKPEGRFLVQATGMQHDDDGLPCFRKRRSGGRKRKTRRITNLLGTRKRRRYSMK